MLSTVTRRATPPPHDALTLQDAYLLLGRRPRVLLAEDDDEVRWSLTALFLNNGFDVQAVSDGAQLLNELERVILGERGRQPPDVIITDVRMPGFNALNIMAGLRDAGWQTPMMVISAFGDSTLRQRVHQLGAARFLDKPLDLDAFEAAVCSAAAERRG